MIPCVTIIGFPLWYLMGGYREAVVTVSDMAKMLWNGEDTE